MGGLVGVALVAVIAVLIVIIFKNKQDSSQYGRSISLYPYCTITCLYTVSRGGTVDNDIPCQNNVVYGVCEMTQTNTLTTAPPPSSLQVYDYPLCDMSEPLPPVYESVDEKDERLTINVNVSYATVAEREDGLSDIYDDVNMRQ